MKKIKLKNFMKITTNIELDKLNIFCGDIFQLRIISIILLHIENTYYVSRDEFDSTSWRHLYQTMLDIFKR